MNFSLHGAEGKGSKALFLFLLLSVSAFGEGWAQPAFGVKFGGIVAQHVGTEEKHSPYEVSSTWRSGLTGGAFLSWPVTDRFSIQQELLYSMRGSSQNIEVEILEIPTTLFVTYEMDYLDIPVMLRYTIYKGTSSSVYTMAGTAMSLKINDRYTLSGELDDGTETVPISAGDDMSEVDLFDFAMVYATGAEFSLGGLPVLAEYRFTMGWNTLSMPTYAYVPFGEEQILIENEPVPLKNQSHSVLLGVRF